jgi:pyrroloquinoline-quinone synthase
VAKDLIGRIDKIIEDKSLLGHPFYQAWNKGELPITSMREYARQYYHFELAYPTFLSGLHYRCSDQSLRQKLLDNLWDEEHGPDNHVELWLRFCDALGLDRQQLRGGGQASATSELLKTYKDLTSTAPLASGAAALYAFESQVPQVARAKIEGLNRFYDMQDERALSFFKVHQTLDEEHSEAERQMVMALASTDAEETASLEATQTATHSLWRFLDGVY